MALRASARSVNVCQRASYLASYLTMLDPNMNIIRFLSLYFHLFKSRAQASRIETAESGAGFCLPFIRPAEWRW